MLAPMLSTKMSPGPEITSRLQELCLIKLFVEISIKDLIDGSSYKGDDLNTGGHQHGCQRPRNGPTNKYINIEFRQLIGLLLHDLPHKRNLRMVYILIIFNINKQKLIGKVNHIGYTIIPNGYGYSAIGLFHINSPFKH